LTDVSELFNAAITRVMRNPH